MEEEKRSRLWRVTATASLIVVILVAAFFVIRIMTNNPTRGIWSSTDSDMTLAIPSIGAVTLSWPESDSLSDLTVKLDSDINRDRQLICFSADEKTAEKAAQQAHDPDTVRATLSMLNGTFYYEVSDGIMTLTDPDSGDSLTFEKAD